MIGLHKKFAWIFNKCKQQSDGFSKRYKDFQKTQVPKRLVNSAQ